MNTAFQYLLDGESHALIHASAFRIMCHYLEPNGWVLVT